MLRLAGSLKMGWVTASLLIGKLNVMPKHNTLIRAMQEYGRLIKTNFILRYLCNPEFQRQIHRQLNKGEALHSLRRYLMVAQEAQIRKRYPDDQLNQAHCLNLVTNAVVVWNTVYMWEAIEQLKREGRQIDEEDMKHLSPTGFGKAVWVHPSFWCKMRGSLLIGPSQLLITVSALRLASIQPRLLSSTSLISPFHT